MNTSDSSGLLTQTSLLKNSIAPLSTDLTPHLTNDLQDPLTAIVSPGRSSSSEPFLVLSSSNLEVAPSVTSSSSEPKTFTVTSVLDIVDPNDGVMTLREAIQAANDNAGADTIEFNLGSGSQTITLTNGQLEILDDLTINGTGADKLRISGNYASRVFQVGLYATSFWDAPNMIPNSPTVTLKDMTIAYGQADNGGGILNTGNLTVMNSVLDNNFSSNFGGGIDNIGALKVINTVLQYNYAVVGGGIMNRSYTKTLEVINSTIKDNSASMSSAVGYARVGGGIYSDFSNIIISGSNILDNHALYSSGGIYIGTNGNATVRNTTIAGNTTNAGNSDIRGFIGGFTSQGGNVIGVGDGQDVFKNGVKGDRVGTTTNPLTPLFNLTVDTLVDEMDNNFSAGDLSLREALALLSSGGTVNFAGNLSGTITLNMGELKLEKNVTLKGPGANRLTISGNQRSRVINIANYATVNLEGLTIANGFSSNGGGIQMNVGSDVRLSHVMVTQNTAANSAGGGGIWNDRGILTAINSTFSANTAGIGGAILNGNWIYSSDQSSTVNLTNSTIAENNAALGGGIYNQTGRLQLTSSTISANQGVGVFNTGSVTVHNTIIAGNTSPVGMSSPDVNGTFISKGYNLIGNGAGSTGFGQVGDQVGTSQQPINSKLKPLGNYGGSVHTMIPLWSSPVFNAGDPALNTERDQHGVLRSQHGRPDIGAVEWVNQAPIAMNDFVNFAGRSVTFNPLSNDLDLDEQSFRLVSYSNPTNGTLTRNANGTFTYTFSHSYFPFPMLTSFSYTIVDEMGASSTAVVTLNRRPG
ncbi:Ig-like domain-containing protein [Pantanalinema rosaneae CENA516]|uniref:Ig-like domain-containing protein n=1 Tax=Pantanalinema rosaneae TaxID=1620701 RepID=UPI003D6FEEA2